MTSKKTKRAPGKPGGGPRASAPFDASRFVRNALLWLIPVAVVWVLMTPFYNRFLTVGTERLVRITERPAATRLSPRPPHHFVIVRADVGREDGRVGSVRITDTHFPLLMLGAFFLAVPGLTIGQRLANLGTASLITVFFHFLSLVFWVKFFYATQLGAWSAEHYGAFGQNFWGLGKHLLDLPFKFAWPLALWCAFHLRLLLPDRQTSRAAPR